MSAADGHIVGMTQIRSSGSPARKWNLVIVADGYVASRMTAFAANAAEVASRLLAEPPFDTAPLANAVNIFRIDVVSRDAGADHPRCNDGAGTGTSARTYFDSTFCSDGKTQRLLYGNALAAIGVAGQFVPNWHQILVLVDDAERGGAGGQVGWFSNGGDDWKEVAIHELGHSAFGLADEYDYGSGDHAPSQEPSEPNVTRERDPQRTKWRHLITSPVPVPTRANPHCGSTDAGPSGFPTAQIGTFEGARYYHCGLYRPVWDCMMRNTNAPFCPVCTEQIHKRMAPYI